MSESRTDLLAWLNDLLQLNYTKVEQCGTGGAYCQIMDSIYGDIPMARVKMNAKQEYEYLANYKILQNIFKAHKISKPIPVERLTKCKMQDNLEFLQWVKKHWDQTYGGQGYDAAARRRGQPTDTPATIAPLSSGRSPVGGAGLSATGTRTGGRTPMGTRSASTQPNEAVQQLTVQVKELSAHLEGLEKERDFYFNKLRDIEILVQQQLEHTPEDITLNEIQKILYATEDGFEVPEGGVVDEEETF